MKLPDTPNAHNPITSHDPPVTYKSSHPWVTSSTTSAKKAPLGCLCLSRTQVTSFYNLIFEQLCPCLIQQQTANLPALPSCELIQSKKPWQRSCRSSRRRNQSLSSRITQRSVAEAARPPLAKSSLPSITGPPSEAKGAEQTDEAFRNLNRPLEEVDHRKSMTIIITNIIAVKTKSLETHTHLMTIISTMHPETLTTNT